MQVIPTRHPRQPAHAGPGWPALVHRGFLAAWTAGGFRCCLFHLQPCGCRPAFSCVTLSMPNMDADVSVKPCWLGKLLWSSNKVCGWVCRTRVLATLRGLLDSYGKGQAPRILITGRPPTLAMHELCGASTCWHLPRWAASHKDTCASSLSVLQGTALAGRSASLQLTTSRQSLRFHCDRCKAVQNGCSDCLKSATSTPASGCLPAVGPTAPMTPAPRCLNRWKCTRSGAPG